MKHTIDFHYPISYVKARHQNPNRVWGRGSVEIEIREITGDQAPVVFEVGNPGAPTSRPADNLFRLKSDGELRKVAMIDGEFYVEDESAADLETKLSDPYQIGSTPLGTLSPIQFIENTSYRDGRHSVEKTIVATTDIKSIRERHGKWSNGKFVSIREEATRDDGGKSMADSLVSRARDLTIVDNTIFIKCREPILKMSAYGNKLEIGERGDTWSPKAPYSDVQRGYSSSLRDSQGFLAFMKKHKLYDGRHGEPQFKVHDASVCRYDGTTSDVQMIARGLLQHFGSSARGLPRDILEASFVLEDILQREQRRLEAISPRLVQALQTLANAKIQKLDQQEALIAQYQTARSDIAKRGNWRMSYEQLARSNFHAAAALYQQRGEGKSIRASALLALERWEAGAGYDRLPIDTTDAMFAVHDGLVIREINTTWQLRMLCERAKIDYDTVFPIVMAGTAVLEIAEDASQGTGLESAVLVVKSGSATILSDRAGLVGEEEAIALANMYFNTDREAKIQNDMAAAILKGPAR